MSRKSKTVKVADMVDRANAYFKNSGNQYGDARRALQSFVEGFLHDARCYRGFRYLTQDEMAAGYTWGVEHKPDGNVFPDETRIQFYQPERTWK